MRGEVPSEVISLVDLFLFFLRWFIHLSVLFVQVIGAPLAAGFLYMDGLANLAGWQWYKPQSVFPKNRSCLP
jgi:hypothetical protein